MKQDGKYTVAVVGATGLVGQKMLQVLEERKFPVKKLNPVASERSVDTGIWFAGEPLTVQPLSETVFEGVDIALFSAGKEISREFAPMAVRSGATVIDNSSAWRMEADVPLVVSEVNPSAIENHKGIIANPNCSTIQMVVVLYPLHKALGIKRVVVSTYQSVSGSGQKAMKQLEDEIQSGKSFDPHYPHPIAFNCLPHIDEFEDQGYTKEELKMMAETRKIMGLPQLAITATTVRVPVHVGHSESVNIEFEKNFDLKDIVEMLQNAPGVKVQDDPAKYIYPMPLFAMERDEVFVGRIRLDKSVRNGLNLWVVADNLRKGAATNSVQIAELLIEKGALQN